MGKVFKAFLSSLFVLSVVQLTTSQTADNKIIESFHVKTDIRFRFATTQMVSVVRNVADDAQEIAFDVSLPKEAFIVNFTMVIDGKEYVGEVKEKHSAKRQYQTAVDRGENAGLIKQAPRHSNVFEVSVNVANGSAVTFTLTYQELLRRKHGHYEHEIHVNPGKPVGNFSIEIFIQENREITFVRTPALRKDVLLSNEVEDENDLALIDRPTPETAHVIYVPTLTQQGDGVSARFAVQYDVNHSHNGEVLVVNGYFIHFYAPDTPPLPKDIIFVLDVSGSMTGNKIKQLKESMVTILKDLKSEDRFNILTFSDVITKWKRNLVRAKSDVVQEAVNFVNRMEADGSTDINKALLTALSELKGREETNRVGMIFFLTDGEPTSGVTNTNTITSNVKRANTDSAAIFGLAFGTGADFDFLKTTCGQNSGFARKIYEASDSALQVASLYDEISSVAMKNVKIKYMSGVSNTTETEFPVVFNGSEITIGGCIDLRQRKFRAEIEGMQRSGDLELVLNIPDINEVTIDIDDSLNTFFTLPRDYAGIVEKMWAFLTIKQFLKEKERIASNEEKAQKLKQKILDMSLKYKFVTPLTSMVVTKPGDENKDKKIESGLEDIDDRHPFRKQSRRRGPSHSQFSPIGGAVSHSHHAMYNNLRKRVRGGLRKQSPNFASFYPNSRSHLFDHDPSNMGNNLAMPTFAATATSHPRLIYTTPAPVATTRKPTGKQGKKKRKTKVKKPPVNIFSSLLIRSPKTSVCIAPRRLLKGKYTLLEGLNGQLKIELSTDCLKNCRFVLPQNFELNYYGYETAVKLSSVKFWQYSQGQNVSVTVTGRNQLNITSHAVEIFITKTSVKRKVLYDIEVVLKTQDTFSGILGHFLKKSMKAKRKRFNKTKVSKACKNKQADVSMKLHKKSASRYMQSSP